MDTSEDRWREDMLRRLTDVGWSRSELARQSRVNQTTVIEVLNGARRPSAKMRERLEDAVARAEVFRGRYAASIEAEWRADFPEEVCEGCPEECDKRSRFLDGMCPEFERAVEACPGVRV